MYECRTCVGGSRYILTVNGHRLRLCSWPSFTSLNLLRFIMTRPSQHKMQNCSSEMTNTLERSPNPLSIDLQLEQDVQSQSSSMSLVRPAYSRDLISSFQTFPTRNNPSTKPESYGTFKTTPSKTTFKTISLAFGTC
jgi:hypothetical protein